MQDIQEPKTFDSPSPLFNFASLSRKRIQLGAKLLAGVAAFGLVSLWLPDRPHLYFDLGVALVLCAVIVAVTGFSLRHNTDRPHAEMGALLHGLGAAGAVFGVVTLALTGDSVGIEEILRLTIGYSVAAVLGAAWSVLIGILVYWPTNLAVRSLVKGSLRQEAVTLGLLTGALALVPLVVRAGTIWPAVASGLLSAVGAHRAAAMHMRYARRRTA